MSFHVALSFISSFQSFTDVGSATLTDIIRFYVVDRLGNRIANQVLSITVKPQKYHAPRVLIEDQLTVIYFYFHIFCREDKCSSLLDPNY